jgi:hypothetical protein
MQPRRLASTVSSSRLPAFSRSSPQFLGYLDGFAVKDVQRSVGYMPCDDGKQNLTGTLCAPGAR